MTRLIHIVLTPPILNGRKVFSLKEVTSCKEYIFIHKSKLFYYEIIIQAENLIFIVFYSLHTLKGTFLMVCETFISGLEIHFSLGSHPPKLRLVDLLGKEGNLFLTRHLF